MKNSMGSVFLVLALLMASLGCGVLSTPVPPTDTPSPIPPTFTPVPPTATATPIVYDIKVTVTDENNVPIPQAKIIQGDDVEPTDAQGIWAKSVSLPELSFRIWAQGYSIAEQTIVLKPGENDIVVSLNPDPFGLKVDDLKREGYELAFVEDFQDGIADCIIDGNGNVTTDEENPENYVLLADLRNLDANFSCSFGPTGILNGIIEVDFWYPEIRYNDFKEGQGGYFHWQGYYAQLRDGFWVDGYPIRTSWGSILQVTIPGDPWTFPIQVQQPIKERTWYRLTTTYTEKRLEVRMNGLLKFNYLKADLAPSKEPASIGAFGQAYIQFDNIMLWLPIK